MSLRSDRNDVTSRSSTKYNNDTFIVLPRLSSFGLAAGKKTRTRTAAACRQTTADETVDDASVRTEYGLVTVSPFAHQVYLNGIIDSYDFRYVALRRRVRLDPPIACDRTR